MCKIVILAIYLIIHLSTTVVGLPSSRRQPITTMSHHTDRGKRKAGDRISFEENEKLRNIRDDSGKSQYGQFDLPLNSNRITRVYSQHYDTFDKHGSSVGFEGRLKRILPLIQQANPLSIGILFAMLIWRLMATLDLMGTELDAVTGLSRFFTSAILITNALGLILTFLSPIAMKNYLKTILAINIIREWMDAFWNLKCWLFGESIDRDVFFGQFVLNAWFLALCYSYRNSRWVPKIVPSKVLHQFQQP